MRPPNSRSRPASPVDTPAATIALKRDLRHPHAFAQRCAEVLKATFGEPGLANANSLPGPRDLVGGADIDVVAVGLGNDVLAHADQLAPEIGVVDRAAVILGIDDRDDRGGEADEILGTTSVGELRIPVEQGFQRHRIGDLPALDHAAAGGESGHDQGRRSGPAGGSRPPSRTPVVHQDGPQQPCSASRLLGGSR